MEFAGQQVNIRLFRAVLDQLLPADAEPGALGLGVDRYVTKMLDRDASRHRTEIMLGLAEVDQRAHGQHGVDFAELTSVDRDEVLLEFERKEWFAALCELVAEGAYADPDNGGNHDAAAWRMIGYRPGLPEGPSGPPFAETLPSPTGGPIDGPEFDVVVVGAGAGGGVAACVLAQAGKRVLLIDRGLERSYHDSGHRDHLRNHRLSLYGHNTGPELEGNPRVFVSPDGVEQVVPPTAIEYGNNASCVGSGTLVYGGLAWRFHPDDFRMASRYGVPEGSSLSDWPIGYDDLESWYARAEWEIGVAGDRVGCPHEPWRSKAYPMPPLASTEATRLLRQGAAKLGIDSFSPPILVNTVPRDERPACIECGSCVGFPCPSNAKNGTQNTVIPRALATGYCTLWTGCTVVRVDTDDLGRVTGVQCVEAWRDGSARKTVRAKAVVLAAGAIETARLLLLSANQREPEGLGNSQGLVGRNLQAHLYPTVFSIFDEAVHESRGPGVTLATTAYTHGNPGIVGGAMIADDFVMMPIVFWKSALPRWMRRWGLQPKDFMRSAFRHVLQVKGPVHEIPNPDSRMQLSDDVTDRFGLPVARLSGTVHPETLRTVGFIYDRAHDWLRAAGARSTWHTPIARRLSAGQHQAGTCRMGKDPVASVTDPFGRVWGHDNLFVSDASLHPTNGAFNPVLTILALAFRNATHAAASI